MGRNASRDKVDCNWISSGPAKTGSILGGIVVVVVDGNLDRILERWVI